jgi:hypothetical protein
MTITAGPWVARRVVDEASAVARSGQPDAFLLPWAEGELRRALGRSPLLDGRPYEIFGQGSRVNNTYIEHSSDIDLVLMLKAPSESVWSESDWSASDWSASGWEEFRDDVLAVLGESYAVRMGRRCVNVDDPDSLFGEMVDILVATEYRRSGEQGVFFRDQEGRAIVNFPKQHRRNGDAKDRRTGGRFKEVVRAVKSVRRLAERERMLVEGTAPSYLLECLLYNVPDEVYRTPSLGEAYRGALDWLRRSPLDDLLCQNGINRLFGPRPDQWEPGAAGTIVDVLHQI